MLIDTIQERVYDLSNGLVDYQFPRCGRQVPSSAVLAFEDMAVDSWPHASLEQFVPRGRIRMHPLRNLIGFLSRQPSSASPF